MRQQVHARLKAKIIMQDETIFSDKGTPQGGILSSLLVNIALNGIEEYLSDWIAEILAFSPGRHRISKPNRRKRLLYVRYADDFVVLHPDKEIIDSVKVLIEEFIRPMGLESHPDKTGITHTFIKIEDQNLGFKFLGFWIKNYQVGKRGEKYKTFIRPHLQNISDVLRKIKLILKQNNNVITVAERLNSIIRGWANYFSTVESKRTFSAINSKLMIQLMKWAKRKHPTRSKKWIRNRYLIRDTKKGKSRLRFGYKGKNDKLIGIYTFAEISIVRHTTVSGGKSIYDNDLIYWSQRGRVLDKTGFTVNRFCDYSERPM